MATLFSALYQSFVAWVARRDNPNQVTAAQLGAETKTTTTASLAKYAPKNILPITYAGNCLDTRSFVLPCTNTNTTFTIDSFPAMFAGIDVIVPQMTVAVKDIATDYRGRTAHLYLVYDGTKVSFTYQLSIGVDTGTSIRIGEISCNGQGFITYVNFWKAFMLGTTRMV